MGIKQSLIELVAEFDKLEKEKEWLLTYLIEYGTDEDIRHYEDFRADIDNPETAEYYIMTDQDKQKAQWAINAIPPDDFVASP